MHNIDDEAPEKGTFMQTGSLRAVSALLIVLAGLTGSARSADRPDRHVILISIDGFPAELLNDPSAPIPTVRRLAEEGTAAEGMIVSNPSVTWPNHTSMVTGVQPARHGVLFNGVLERSPGLPVKVNPRKDKADLVQVPTVYDVLSEAGQTVAAINWPCTRNSGAIDFDFPDVPETFEHTTPALLEELKQAGILTDELIRDFMKRSPAARDLVWTRAAAHVIRTHKPNLVLFHLLNVDAVHHRYGPQTWAGYTALAWADACVREVLDAVDAAGIRDRTTILIVADHGFMAIPKTLQPNVLLRQVGLLTLEGNQVATARAHVFPEGGIGMLYLTVPETAEQDREKVLSLFRDRPEIADVLTSERFSEFGLPLPGDYRQMADLVLVAKDGYGFSATATGEEFVVPSDTTVGTHGFLSTNPKMNAVFVASGAGVRRGAELGIIRNIDVAPTIAHLLGVKLESVDGQVRLP